MLDFLVEVGGEGERVDIEPEVVDPGLAESTLSGKMSGHSWLEGSG